MKTVLAQDENIAEINTEHLQSGTYFLKVTNEQNSQVFKINIIK